MEEWRFIERIMTHARGLAFFTVIQQADNWGETLIKRAERTHTSEHTLVHPQPAQPAVCFYVFQHWRASHMG